MKKSWVSFMLLLCLLWIAGGCTSPAPTMTPAPPTTVAPPPTVAPVQPDDVDPLPVILEHLRFLDHASFRLDGPPTIYFDPTNLRGEVIPADVILISHDHSDHYAPRIVKQISTAETVIITNEMVATRLKSADVAGEIRVLKPGEETAVGEVTIEAVPAYNIGKSYHPKEAGGLGFIVTWGGERLYFAGDTSRIPEMQEIECDVALLPIDGTYTMDAQEAAQAAADIGPKVAVPMHMLGANPEEFRDLCECTVVILEP